jgi:hypothetical protein
MAAVAFRHTLGIVDLSGGAWKDYFLNLSISQFTRMLLIYTSFFFTHLTPDSRGSDLIRLVGQLVMLHEASLTCQVYAVLLSNVQNDPLIMQNIGAENWNWFTREVPTLMDVRTSIEPPVMRLVASPDTLQQGGHFTTRLLSTASSSLLVGLVLCPTAQLPSHAIIAALCSAAPAMSSASDALSSVSRERSIATAEAMSSAADAIERTFFIMKHGFKNRT